MAAGRESGEKRGRGRPQREPQMPPGVKYEDWRGMHLPVVKGLLIELDQEERDWNQYTRRLAAAHAARDTGLPVEPVEASPMTLWRLIRAAASMPAQERAKQVEALQKRRRPMPSPGTIHDFVAWLTGEALFAGIASDHATPYQAWFVIAELVLCDSDIGAIIREVHPERIARKAKGLKPSAVRQLDADLARQERKLVNANREAFGYRAG